MSMVFLATYVIAFTLVRGNLEPVTIFHGAIESIMGCNISPVY